MSTPGLFAGLLGSSFAALSPRVREVHRGGSVRLRGRATVTRSDALLGRLIGCVASLPAAQQDSTANIELVAHGYGETWTRHFGTSRPMRSYLQARDGLLVERLGPVRLRFRLHEHQAAIVWQLHSVSFCGIPVPRRWFTATAARSFEHQDRYCFEVNVALGGIGHLVGYRGSIDSIAAQSASSSNSVRIA